jgi:hypothetical protein
MPGMKRPQFSLRKLFAILTLVAFFIGIYVERQRRSAIGLHDAAVKAYLSELTLIDHDLSTWPDAAKAATKKNMDDNWKKHYPTWPLPDVPPGR